MTKPMLVALAIIAVITGCADGKYEFSVMSYNVENLFDTVDDGGIMIEDESYLPLSEKKLRGEHHVKLCEDRNDLREDGTRGYYYYECLYLDWSEDLLRKKMQQIADVVLSYRSKNGKGPDVLLLQEVENINVLERLNNEYLSEAGYETVILKASKDERGITQAILSRLSSSEASGYISWQTKDEEGRAIEAERGFVKATFELPYRQKLSILNVHFPSNSHPLEQRQDGLKALTKAADALHEKGHMVIAGGDFNIKRDDGAALYEEQARIDWAVGHLADPDQLKEQGTYYYGKNQEWSFFDTIMIHKNSLARLNDFIRVPYDSSFEIFNPKASQKTEEGFPRRFKNNIGEIDEISGTVEFVDEEEVGEGVSDHWPVVMKIEVMRPSIGAKDISVAGHILLMQQ